MKQRFSFKSALKAFGKNPYRAEPLRDADQSHLERWVADPRADRIWARYFRADLDGSWPERMANSFINVVLAMRREVEAESKLHVAQKHVRAIDLKARKATMWQIKRAAKAVATELSDHPAVWRERARLLNTLADLCMQQIPRPRVIARTSHHGEKQQLFSVKMSHHFRLVTGRWCDQEVAALTEIAFPGKDVTVDMVRAGRRTTK